MPSSGFAPFPELEPGSDVVAAQRWVLDGTEVGDQSAIPGWNYEMRLRLARHLAIEPAALRRACGLGKSSAVRLAVAWTAHSAINAGNLAARVDFELDGDSRLEETIVVEIPSSELADSVEIISVLALVRRGQDATPIAARDPGSVLWRDSMTLILEGSRPRLSILPQDFGALPGPEQGAAWYLWTSPEWLSLHPTAGITVYVNSGRPAILAALRTRRGGSTELAVQSVFFHEVGRALLERALDDDDFSEEQDYARGTSGHSIRARLHALFGRASIDEVRTLRRIEPMRFERILQSSQGLLGRLS